MSEIESWQGVERKSQTNLEFLMHDLLKANAQTQTMTEANLQRLGETVKDLSEKTAAIAERQEITQRELAKHMQEMALSQQQTSLTLVQVQKDHNKDIQIVLDKFSDYAEKEQKSKDEQMKYFVRLEKSHIHLVNKFEEQREEMRNANDAHFKEIDKRIDAFGIEHVIMSKSIESLQGWKKTVIMIVSAPAITIISYYVGKMFGVGG